MEDKEQTNVNPNLEKKVADLPYTMCLKESLIMGSAAFLGGIAMGGFASVYVKQTPDKFNTAPIIMGCILASFPVIGMHGLYAICKIRDFYNYIKS